jgi:hypothetical protein
MEREEVDGHAKNLLSKCAARTTRLVASGSVVAITFVKFYIIWCRVHESACFSVLIELAEGRNERRASRTVT